MKPFYVYSRFFSLCICIVVALYLNGGKLSAKENPEGTISKNNKNGATRIEEEDTEEKENTESKVQLRWIVDPSDKASKKKVSIPRNYNGLLYLRGLNISSLRSKLIFARFHFGRELEIVDIPAIIARPGNVIPYKYEDLVVVLDLKKRPFDNIRLLYDLFDYNNYWDSINTREGEEPVSDPRDDELYCRGLDIKYDPTFVSTNNNGLCDASEEVCYYAYAKLLDSGFYNQLGERLPVSWPQIDLTGNGYDTNSEDENLTKCLPDNNNSVHFNALFDTNVSQGSLSYNSSIAFSDRTFIYNGPFVAVNQSEWQISDGALFSPIDTNSPQGSGLFQYSLNQTADSGYGSFMFPRAGRMKLRAGIGHFSSATPFGQRSLQALSVSGQTSFMDGCNLRMIYQDPLFNETISSCNVTASIELYTKDFSSNEEETIVHNREIKLQLIRPSLTDKDEEEYLHGSLKKCLKNSNCASGECCFSGRCWSNKNIAQCKKDDDPIVGTSPVGANCTSDYQCASLCCDSRVGTCQVHDEASDPPVYCSKAIGQSCVGSRWCQRQNLQQRLKIQTLVRNGIAMCTLKTYIIPSFAQCIEGICVAPPPCRNDFLNPVNPSCEDARPAPSFNELDSCLP